MISTAQDIKTFFCHNRISIQVIQEAETMSLKKVYLRDLNFDTHAFDDCLNYIETNKMGNRVKTEKIFATNLLCETFTKIFKEQSFSQQSDLDIRKKNIEAIISNKLLLI